MLVSVSISAYNEENYLPAIFESLINQTYPHKQIEIIFWILKLWIFFVLTRVTFFFSYYIYINRWGEKQRFPSYITFTINF